jgi:uncharacterized membrane protein
MSLHPLLVAPTLYQMHAFLALLALGLGATQFALPKGSRLHRAMGYTWVACMAIIALSSFGIQELKRGHFSYIHVISIVTLVVLPFAVLHARRGRIRRHAISMVSLFVGALVIAGAFTLLPGRIMHHVVFGQVQVLSQACG